jgi:hypothetical protein
VGGGREKERERVGCRFPVPFRMKLEGDHREEGFVLVYEIRKLRSRKQEQANLPSSPLGNLGWELGHILLLWLRRS